MQEPLPTSLSSDAYEAHASPWYAPLFANPALTFVCIAVPLGLGLSASLIPAPKYLARGKIILPNSSSRTSALAGLAGSFGISTDAGSLPMFTSILKSEAMLKRLSARSGLPRKDLRKIFGVRDDPKSNTIEISALGKDRQAMLRILKDSLLELNSLSSQVNLPVKEDQTSRLSNALTNRQRDLARAEAELKTFLGSAKTLPGGGIALKGSGGGALGNDGTSSTSNDLETIQPGLGYKQQLSSLEIELQKLDSSVEAIRTTSKEQEKSAPLDLPPVALWADKIASAQTKLSELRPRYRPGSPEIVEAEQALKGIQADRKRDIDRYLTSVRASLTGPAQNLSVTRAGIQKQIDEVKKFVDAAPDETIRYLRLLRAVGQNETIVSQIRLLYEKSRVEQTNDPNTWAVLDYPEIDEEYDSRNTTRNAVVGGLAGLGLAYSLGSRRTSRSNRAAA